MRASHRTLSKTCLSAVLVASAAFGTPLAAQQPAAPALDYEYFKKNVQPVFVKKRVGHAKCTSCHAGEGSPVFALQPLAKGSTTWTEEETKKNFAAIQKVAIAGNAKSMLLIHPLDESAGGDFYHSGGKHWTSQSDPEWQLLRNFVMGQTK
jgi:hypothetical protein